MVMDLLILTIIGCILEFLAVRLGSTVFNGCITAGFSLLITFIAVTRWNLYGLIVCPFLALATFLGGRQIAELSFLRETYDWKLALATGIGLCTMGVNVIFYKKIGTSNVINSLGFIGLFFLDYLLFTFIQFVFYRLLTSPDFIHVGERYFEIVITNEEGISETVRKNLCQLGEGGIIYNIFGLCVLIIGSYVLRSQGVICNAVQRLIDDKKNAELDRIDKNFSIQEAEEGDDSVGESHESEE